MPATKDRLSRLIAPVLAVACAGWIPAACTRGPAPANAAASPIAAELASPSRALTAPVHPPGAGAGYVSDDLPMGYWLSLDHRLKQPEAAAAPRGVTPNLTYNLDEGTENLITDFGEQLARSTKGEPSYGDCLHAVYSPDDVVDVPRLPTGSWFCARDRSGHLAKIRLDGVDEDKAVLRLAYGVWK